MSAVDLPPPDPSDRRGGDPPPDGPHGPEDPGLQEVPELPIAALLGGPPGDVPIEPIPTQIRVLPVVRRENDDDPGRPLVALRMSTALGPLTFFLAPDAAENLGRFLMQMVAQMGAAAQPGLVVAGADDLPRGEESVRRLMQMDEQMRGGRP